MKVPLNKVTVDSHVTIVRPDLRLLDGRYFGYAVISRQAYIETLGAGATGQTELSRQSLSEVCIPLPPLPVQRKIAAILSAYDDLIENNNRRIAILEEMAQAIYREWFVHFRFPGHEDVAMVDSELGPIPEGWQVTTLAEVSQYIARGIAPKYDDRSNSRVVNQRCIRQDRIDLELARKHSGSLPEEKYLRFGDVLINSTGVGTLGRVAQVYQPIADCTVDTHVTIVRSADPAATDYIGLSLLNRQPYFASQGFGSTGQTELRQRIIGETALCWPPRYLQKAFADAVQPMRLHCIILATKSANLRRTRDLLLPRLVSGEVDVSDLPIDTEGLDA